MKQARETEVTILRDEKRLISRLKRGEPTAFAELIETHGAALHRLVRRYARPDDADDLTQEVFVEVWRSIGGFRGESALSTWLYRIAVNRCLRYCKRDKGQALPLEEEILTGSPDSPELFDDAPYRSAVRSETADRVNCAVDRLPDGQRDVVILCELHGLTYAECANVLEIPVGTVKSRLSNAARKLRESLRDYVQNEETVSDLRIAKEATR